jgi:sugar phosphate isomerase/epimerase
MDLSLAGWSLQRLFRRSENPLKLTDFARFSKEQFGITALELNNIFFESTDPKYLSELRASAEDAGCRLLNIAVDEQGDLSNTNHLHREIAILNYARWIPVAAEIGCSAIRANSGGKDLSNPQASLQACIESFRRLCDIARPLGVAVLMENHWGLSSDPEAMVRLMEAVESSHGKGAIGTVPDFGNWPKEIDRIAALKRILPYAQAVHAKVMDIDESLAHPAFDLEACVRATRESGYKGYLGIEYEGSGDCVEGVKRASRKLRGLIA